MPRRKRAASPSVTAVNSAPGSRTFGAEPGHLAGFCNAAPGCRSVFYDPPHEPGKQQWDRPGTAN